MATTINASTSAGLVSTADTSGVLQLQTANTTALTLSAAQAATFAGTAQFPTTIGVGGATPSTRGSGITFPATASRSSNVNTLDDYETGTWTITITDGTNNAVMANNTGNYVKVGKNVTVGGYFQTTGLGSIAGGSTIKISGLPFSVANDLGATGAGVFGLGSGHAITAGQTLVYYAEPNTSSLTMGIWSSTAGTTAITGTAWGTGTTGSTIGITYQTSV
jgi:hypothetical protein